MGVGTGAVAAAPIFLPIIKIGTYRKTKKKRIKSLFSHAMVLRNSQVSSSLTAIIAHRDNGERLNVPHHWKAYLCTLLPKQRD